MKIKNSKLFLTALFATILLISCSSDDDSPNEPGETPKFVKTEKASENLKIDYQYNEAGFLTKSVGTYPSFDYESNFSYDSDNNLTQWISKETGGAPSTSTTTFTYDGQGRLTNYSQNSNNVAVSYFGNTVTLSGTIEGDANASAELELNANGLIIKFTEAIQYTTFQYDSNGNMIAAESFDNDDNAIKSFSIIYDNKVNPFFGQFRSIYFERFIEFFWEFDGIYVSGFEGYNFPFNKNNFTSIKENNVEFTSYIYSYDNENFPTIVNEDYDGDTFQYSLEYTR